jgi:hypothetical protein
MIEGGGELAEILRCNSIFKISDRAGDDGVDHVANGNILIARDEVLHVGEHLLEFAQLVFRKLPVACIAGGMCAAMQLGLLTRSPACASDDNREECFKLAPARDLRWRWRR